MNNINISDNDIICTRGVFSNLKFLKRPDKSKKEES
jgi:hypothetical protein